MKTKVCLIQGLAALLLLSPLPGNAQPAGDIPAKNLNLSKPITTDPGNDKEPLPDLKATSIRLVKGSRWGGDCKVQTAISNIGTAGVPASFYDLPYPVVVIRLLKDDKLLSDRLLSYIDRQNKLMKPDGYSVFVWGIKIKPGTTQTFKLIVDERNALGEPNTRNNTIVSRLECKPSLLKQTKSTVTDSTTSYKTITLSPYQKLVLTSGKTIVRSTTGILILEGIEMNAHGGTEYPNAKLLKDSKNIAWIETSEKKIKMGSFLRIVRTVKTLAPKVIRR